jgi:hypothetical protein
MLVYDLYLQLNVGQVGCIDGHVGVCGDNRATKHSFIKGAATITVK